MKTTWGEIRPGDLMYSEERETFWFVLSVSAAQEPSDCKMEVWVLENEKQGYQTYFFVKSSKMPEGLSVYNA